MKRLRLSQLTEADVAGPFVLAGRLTGRRIVEGGLSIRKPGECPHPEPHTHEHAEVFIAMQGRARLEVDGRSHVFRVGDVVVIEPGEDHRYFADERDPLVNLWFHAE